MTEDEFIRVLRVFDVTIFHGYRNWIVTRLMLDTVMRISGCLELLPEKIDFKHKAILIENSNNKQQCYTYFSFNMLVIVS
ncbi:MULTISPECIES: tyrosine-type recombinase/integrase [Bacillus]|uniref:tyrosine-type recombinase/integrase n=1 Tax=Bacillus TaxID=1386 RepID=UPI001CB957D5